MSKWRPAKKCLYVIPDIHGQYYELQLILSRILPLRKNDQLVFLGDYIDRRIDSHKVVDCLISLKKNFKNNIITLCGNHEDMLLDAIKPNLKSNKYLMWMTNGGEQTLSGYLDRANNHMDNPYELLRSRVIDFIPDDHLKFFKNLDYYYEYDNFIFVHAGCDPFRPLNEQNEQVLIWDRSLYNSITSFQGQELPWDKTVITGHNCDVDFPFINEKFMMLDCSTFDKLLVLELNSMECFVAKHRKKRLVKLDIGGSNG